MNGGGRKSITKQIPRWIHIQIYSSCRKIDCHKKSRDGRSNTAEMEYNTHVRGSVIYRLYSDVKGHAFFYLINTN